MSSRLVRRLRYDNPTHQTLKRVMRGVVDGGNARCCLCGGPIPAGSSFDLDHDPDGNGYRGVAHVKCNRSDGGKRSHGRPFVRRVSVSL